jgi:hypothetical protein
MMIAGVEALAASADFQAGDRVKTLKGSLRGTILKVLEDGRVIWQPDGQTSELTALPESFLKVPAK